MLHSEELARRLRPFTDAGLLERVPTPWQLRQAELEMAPWVVSTDVTAEEGYEGAPLGHPIARQPLIFAHVGLDHLRTGSGLGARLVSVCRHLELTHHRGMPVFDLQVIQTHEGGLDVLRSGFEELLAGRTRRARRQGRLAGWIFADQVGYYRRFLGDDGWISRASRFDYPTPEEEGSSCPPEFFSLVGLAGYAARAFPERLDMPVIRVPRYTLRLLSRRFREGRGMGWLSRARVADDG